MRKIAALTFLTLDGVMQSPSSPDEDPSGDFAKGGWAQPLWDEVMEQVAGEAMADPFDLLFGRKTYDLFAGHFTTAAIDDPISKRLNDARKFVVTRSPKRTLPWQNSIAVTGDIVSELTRLKSEEGPLLQIHGSCDLLQTLVSAGMVDEFRLWTFPVLTGAGKKLFNDGVMPSDLRLIKTASTLNGAVMSFYKLGDRV